MEVQGLQQINPGLDEGQGRLHNDIAPSKGPSFMDYMNHAVDQANQLDLEAEDLSMQLAAGELDNTHEAVIAAQKAETSLQFITEIRNKVLDAYNEVMRMQI
ncbi:flagellar hook-basal body complex protein FliE [Isachenkonia alkalipeptolytica]|uniref:Flagellar hook-basal body complex protein FliE n=1 Tax=Isachenkonia alkalipeptolytica TaxID=2565777 RepID=A0AA43XJQ9_9CLOT|nr:flagellar hook-basal body complex protein FliE [Isachenkonia alkalipeptolytica]NBG87561.1 flagellar hook-basal body complex protein FliE [Isachenkonia alkalipeptolytica]